MVNLSVPTLLTMTGRDKICLTVTDFSMEEAETKRREMMYARIKVKISLLFGFIIVELSEREVNFQLFKKKRNKAFI